MELTAQGSQALDLYFVYEFHLTLLGSRYSASSRRRARKRSPDLYFMYECHVTLLSSQYPAELTAQGAERPLGLILLV